MNSETAMGRSITESSLLDPTSAESDIVGPKTPLFMEMSDSESRTTPQSPYSVTRSHLQFLTPPPIPRMDIPPSPPGTISVEMNEKFQHFFNLKKQGVHFNEKLALSTALKNPGLFQKLMEFAGIEGEGFYDTTLPRDIWDPSEFEGSSKNQDAK